MKIQLKSDEDLTIVTKGGGNVIVPNNTDTSTDKILATVDQIGPGGGDKANAASLADPYESDHSSAYVVGDYVTHEGTLYKCKSDTSSPPGEWDDNNWTATNINTAKANDNAVVKLTGNQTIAGTKTFTGNCEFNAQMKTAGINSLGSLFANGITVKGGFNLDFIGDGSIIMDGGGISITKDGFVLLQRIRGPQYPPNFIVLELDSDGTSVGQYNILFPLANGTVAIQSSIAPSFSDSETYAVGDYVSHEGLLYKCATAVETSGSWTGDTNWAEVTVTDEMGGGVGDRIVSENENTKVVANNDGTATIDKNVLTSRPIVHLTAGTFSGYNEIVLQNDVTVDMNNATRISDSVYRLTIDGIDFDYVFDGNPEHGRNFIVSLNYEFDITDWDNVNPTITLNSGSYTGVASVSRHAIDSKVIATVDQIVVVDVVDPTTDGSGTGKAADANSTGLALELTPATFSNWKTVPTTYNGYPITIELMPDGKTWAPFANYNQIGIGYSDENQTSLNWTSETASIPISASRSVIGYVLGDQTDKELASVSVIGDINSVLDAINGEVI